MFGRTATVGIVVLWTASTLWLVWCKVLPPLRVGTPPSYRTLIEDLEHGAPGELNENVGWRLTWNGQPVGTAENRVIRRSDDVIELRSEVRIAQFPLHDLLPPWLSTVAGDAKSQYVFVNLHSENRVELDPLGQLLRLEAEVSLAGIPVKVRGEVHGQNLKLTIRSGAYVYEKETGLPPDGMLGGVLAPESHLARLQVGQTWTVPIVNPFLPGGGSVEIMQARVDREEALNWNGDTVPTLVVAYSKDSGAGLQGEDNVQGRMWVRADGAVLQQQMTVLGSRITFVRIPQPTVPQPAASQP